MIVDIELKRWATPKQAAYIEAVNTHGSFRAAGRALGTHDSVRKSIRALEMRAAVQGYAPAHDMTHTVPSPFVVKGVSTYHEKTSTTPAAWVKASLDERLWTQSIKDGVAAFIADIEPIPANSGPTTRGLDTDIIPWIQIGDAHLGMLAHEQETGQNFDLKIAELELCEGISLLIDGCGDHERCVINDNGDFTHYENFAAITEASGHNLDADGRFPKMITVYSRIMRFVISKALTKFRYVDVIVNQGNHSRTNDIWMAELIRVAYGHTNRVNVLNNATKFIAYRMGNTLVMTHHSDKCKPNRLAQVMTVDFRKDWGETEYHYIDIGHIHHNMVSAEHPGVQIESWNILAPADLWAHDGGYRSRQSITVVDRSRTYGELSRRRLPIQKIRDSILSKSTGSPVMYRAQPKTAFTV